MKKIWLRNSLSLLLTGVLLLSAMPVGAAGGTDDETTQFPAGEQPPIVIDPSDDETPIIPINPGTSASEALYSWTASDLNQDVKVFSSNLSDDSDPNQRWNESAQMYTEQEDKTVILHSFLNAAEDTYGLNVREDAAGRTAVENLRVDLYPMVQISDDIGAVSLSFVYAHKPAENGLNPANSGLLQVYASADGVNWSEDFAKVRSARIVGSGIGQDGKDIIYYEIFTEDLKTIAGDEINVLRIMPDGNSGMCGGSFSLCSLTLNGYETQSAFIKAVPEETEGAAADRNAVLQAYQTTSGTALARAQAAMALVTRAEVDSIPAMLDTVGLRFANGIAIKATADVREIFDWMYAAKLRTWANMQPILDKYEDITNTEKVIKDLNRPQQIFKAYAKCDVGDLLVQVKADGKTSNVYMVEKVSAQPDKAGNIDIATSTITYVDSTGSTKTNVAIFDLYKQGFVPMVMDALADDAVQPVRVDAHVSVTDQVRLAVSSNFDIEKIELSVDDFADTVTQPGAAAIYTNSSLDELPAGKYTMTAKVYTAANGTPIDVSIPFAVQGEPMEVLANVDMVNALDMNFYVAQSNFEGEGYYAKLVGPNGTKTVPMTAWKTNGSYYQFTYDGLAAKQMSADITVTVYDANGNRVSRPWVDSIRTYVMRMLDNPEHTIAYTMFVDMLNYGTAAQKYFNYQTDDLANSLLSDAQKVYGTETAETCTDGRVKGDNYYGTNFDLENRISMNLYFTNVTDEMTATITYADHYGKQHEVTVPGTEFSVNGSCKVINVSEIVAADGRQPVTCTIRNGDEVVASVTDSLESYVARMSSNYPWLWEIMKFSDSARNYLHAKNQSSQ